MKTEYSQVKGIYLMFLCCLERTIGSTLYDTDFVCLCRMIMIPIITVKRNGCLICQLQLILIKQKHHTVTNIIVPAVYIFPTVPWPHMQC